MWTYFMRLQTKIKHTHQYSGWVFIIIRGIIFLVWAVNMIGRTVTDIPDSQNLVIWMSLSQYDGRTVTDITGSQNWGIWMSLSQYDWEDSY